MLSLSNSKPSSDFIYSEEQEAMTSDKKRIIRLRIIPFISFFILNQIFDNETRYSSPSLSRKKSMIFHLLDKVCFLSTTPP